MRVLFAPAAIADLQEITDYITADNPARAATFVAELIDRCHTLRERGSGITLNLGRIGA